MSFKRDGDDYCLLNRLKHQRVTDLLGNYIPDEEAKQLSNGRFTCLVCEYRPIFDTIKILAIHRKGKKHLQELSKYIKRKSYFELEALKKEQQDAFHFNQKEDDLSSSGLNPTLLGNKEYFAIKLKRKISDRRRTLELPTFINEIETMKTKLQDNYEVRPSPASQVRHYLKQLPRKVSLEMMVEKKTKCYSTSVGSPKMKEQPKKSLQTKKPTVKSVKPKNSGISDLSMNMSGWIKDKFGNWVKDPDAEFDSDDNEPHPVFPT